MVALHGYRALQASAGVLAPALDPNLGPTRMPRNVFSTQTPGMSCDIATFSAAEQRADTTPGFRAGPMGASRPFEQPEATRNLDKTFACCKHQTRAHYDMLASALRANAALSRHDGKQAGGRQIAPS